MAASARKRALTAGALAGLTLGAALGAPQVDSREKVVWEPA